MERIPPGAPQLLDVPELTHAAVESARANPEIGCLIDRVYPGRPLLISFGFNDWKCVPNFDFFGRTKKLEERLGCKFNRLLLRDVANAWYHRGVPGLGAHVDEVAATLRSLIRSIRPTEVITIGQSMGGYGAILFGMLLGADRIVAFGPLSHLDPSEAILYGDRRFLPVMQALQADPPKSAYLDLPQLGEALHYQGDLHVIFGTHPGHHDGVSDNLDALHALRLARLPNVTLAPYPESAHPVVQWLIEHEQLDDLLAERLVPDPPVDEPTPPISTAGSSSNSEILNKVATKLYRSFKFHVINTSHHGDGTGQAVSYAAVGQGNLEPAYRARVDDDWRCWIAENLILDASAAELEDVLVARGISETEASLEVSRALQSPHFWGIQRLRNRLKKRDWLFACYRKLQRLRPESETIERRHKLARGEWLDRFSSANRPVIITGMMDDWPALRNWSLDSFSQRFGDREIEVELGHDLGDERELARPAERSRMLMADYVELLRQADQAEGSVLSADEGSSNKRALAELENDIGDVSEYLDSRASAAESFRLGGVGAIVPLQNNPANLLLAQVLGHTQVRFAYSWDLPLIQNNKGVFARLDGASRPPVSSLPLDEPQILECLLAPGEILFLPIGSWFLLEGLEVSATVTFRNLPFHDAFDAGPEDLDR